MHSFSWVYEVCILSLGYREHEGFGRCVGQNHVHKSVGVYVCWVASLCRKCKCRMSNVNVCLSLLCVGACVSVSVCVSVCVYA